jgi:hypothetical protein
MCVVLISEQTGTIVDMSGFDRILALDSYAGHFRLPKVGDELMRTTDLFTVPGIVYLSHVDLDVVQRDYAAIRTLERQHRLFAVSETAFA